MEAVYRRKGDKRILLYEEGNQILAQVIGAGRAIQWGSLCRDYHSCGVSRLWEEEIYVAYVNTENVLMWDKLFAEGRLMLVKGETWGSLSDVKIAPLAGDRTQLYVWYRMAEAENGTDSLYAINPLGERKVQRLVHGTGRIERYEILQHGEVSYLLYKLATEAKPRIYAVDVSRLGDISLSEYILCKEQTMQELEKRCKENDKSYNEAIRKMQEDYESRLKSTVKNMEQRYKQQYDELTKLTQGMQEEGRKWRELYYKSVTKD